MTPEERMNGYVLRDAGKNVVARGPAAQAGWRVGLTLHWEAPAEPTRRTISPAARYRGRRRRLRKRLERRYPLLADRLYDEETKARPAYYGLKPGHEA